MSKQSVTISFRVSPNEAQQLEGDARQYGVSRNDFVRNLTRRYLNGDDHEQLDQLASQLADMVEVVERADDLHHRRLDGVSREVGQLRNDLATAVVALLVKVANVSLDDAEQWARETMSVRT